MIEFEDEEFKGLEHIVSTGRMLDTLVALVEQGPVWAGDVPSKIGRDELIALGLAFPTLVKGEDGYTGITYRGRNLYCYYFGKSDTVREAKAYRLARRAMRQQQTNMGCAQG
jgi:hypothetical protein